MSDPTSGSFFNASNLSESAISRENDLPDHVNESEIHFSATLSLPSVTSPWRGDVRMKRDALLDGHYQGCHKGGRIEACRCRFGN